MADYLQLKPADRYGRVGIERRRVDGSLVAVDAQTFQSDRHFALCSKALDVPRDLIIRAVDCFRRDSMADRIELPPEKPPFSCVVRGRTMKAENGFHYSGEAADCIHMVFGVLTPFDALVCWEGTEQVAVLDLDGEVPAAFAECVSPRPAAWWASHHGGSHLLYFAAQGMQAGELAAVAALSALDQRPTLRAEVKADTRHPLSPDPDGTKAGEVHWRTANADTGHLASFLGPRLASSPDVVEWLQSKGLEMGRRYDHTHCPMHPDEEGGVGTQPVDVREEGIKCYRCEGRGLGGWWTYRSLTGQSTQSALAHCVKHFTHWDHARHVMGEAFALSPDLSRLAYSAALRLTHGTEDPRIDRVFRAGRGLLRFDRSWVNEQGETYHVMGRGIRALLSDLPAARRSDDEVDEARVELLEQPTDLYRLGYHALHPVWSVRIASQHVLDRDETRVPIVVQCGWLASPARSGQRARYMASGSARLEQDAAWAIVERWCPGVDRNGVLALIAAKGCAEAGIGMHPFVFLTGPTGSGKTTSVQLAAAICGDMVNVVPWGEDRDRLRAAVRTAKEQGSFCCFDEVSKGQRSLGRKGTRALDFVLTLTADSVSHKLYTGPVRMGDLPVVVFADTAIPSDVKGDGQLARRITHIPLVGRKDWKSQRVGLGIDLTKMRLAGEEYVKACDSILSYAIDRWFMATPTFETVAAELGFRTLERSDEAEVNEDLLRELFSAVCEAPEMSPTAARMSARGWRRVERGANSRLARVWEQVCDGLDDEGYHQSRMCTAVDWQQLCSLSVPAEFESSRAAGGAAKLRIVNKASPVYRFDKELA